MPTDKENVQFLYSIIKQLEVKHIKWDTIAETNAIAKPHTARMRFHRLRQTMEGTVSKPRQRKNHDGPSNKDKSKASYSRKAKDTAKKLDLADFSEDEEEPLAHLKAKRRFKYEEDSGDEYVLTEPESKPDVKKRIKHEEHSDEVVKEEENEAMVINGGDITKRETIIKDDAMVVDIDNAVKRKDEAEVIYIKTENKDV